MRRKFTVQVHGGAALRVLVDSKDFKASLASVDRLVVLPSTEGHGIRDAREHLVRSIVRRVDQAERLDKDETSTRG